MPANKPVMQRILLPDPPDDPEQVVEWLRDALLPSLHRAFDRVDEVDRRRQSIARLLLLMGA